MSALRAGWPLAFAALTLGVACGDAEPQKFDSLLVPNLRDEQVTTRGGSGTRPEVSGGSGGRGGSAGASSGGGGSGGSGSGGVAGYGGETGVEFVDPTTGLVWRDAGFASDPLQAQALCQSLSEGSFEPLRLPTIDELRSLVTGCYSTSLFGACGVSTSCTGSACYSVECAGCGDVGGCYGPSSFGSWCEVAWSSTLGESGVWQVDFRSGAVQPSYGTSAAVLCVEGEAPPPPCTATSYVTSETVWGTQPKIVRDVCEGQLLSFTASGTWCWGGPPIDCSDPNGTAGRPLPEELPVEYSSAYLGTLIGRIDGTAFTIGSGTTIVAPVSGQLELLMNDRIGYASDNTGSLTVDIVLDSYGP